MLIDDSDRQIGKSWLLLVETMPVVALSGSGLN